MAIRKGQEIELDIINLAFGGKGIAKVDGFTIFVDQAVPGDRVLARIIKKKKSHAEARMMQVVTASPDRITPSCPYSGHCGGCAWQCLAYEKQLEYKRRHIVEALDHLGGIKGVDVNPTLPSNRRFGYRNKMEFTCTNRRWLMTRELEDKTLDMEFALGFHTPGIFDKILDIDACRLQPEIGNQILCHAKQYMKVSGYPPYSPRTHEGFWRFLMLRYSFAFDHWLVNIVTATENLSAVSPLAASLSNRFPGIVSIVNNITSRKSGISVGEYEIHLAGERCLKERLGPYEFEISANSFFQTNTEGAVNLYNTVKQFAHLSGSEKVLDLYSGTGTIPIWLSDSAAEVIGIEIAESAVADAQKNCAQNNISNCRFISGDIRSALSEIKQKPDLLIIDPPRTGMHPGVVKQIMDMAPEKMVYISCNPATLARDAGMMKDRYRIVEVQPVDMFPHTYHIEAVVKFEKLNQNN
jgi:23S rRNA (uracil1939-C5)-methyltransferase